jgi:hypothetical protein
MAESTHPSMNPTKGTSEARPTTNSPRERPDTKADEDQKSPAYKQFTRQENDDETRVKGKDEAWKPRTFNSDSDSKADKATGDRL